MRHLDDGNVVEARGSAEDVWQLMQREPGVATPDQLAAAIGDD